MWLSRTVIIQEEVADLFVIGYVDCAVGQLDTEVLLQTICGIWQ